MVWVGFLGWEAFETLEFEGWVLLVVCLGDLLKICDTPIGTRIFHGVFFF